MQWALNTHPGPLPPVCRCVLRMPCRGRAPPGGLDGEVFAKVVDVFDGTITSDQVAEQLEPSIDGACWSCLRHRITNHVLEIERRHNESDV